MYVHCSGVELGALCQLKFVMYVIVIPPDMGGAGCMVEVPPMSDGITILYSSAIRTHCPTLLTPPPLRWLGIRLSIFGC